MTFARFVATTSICAVVLAAPASSAQVLKLGSIAPAGSPWDDALKKINNEWTKVSGGTVSLKIYAGGVAGDEMDMIRKMRMGQLQAAGISGVGLCRIQQTILNVQLPLLIRTDEELVYVLDKMKPSFTKSIEEKGFRVIVWSVVGWACFFSKTPVVNPDDLKKQRLFVYAGDDDAVQTWKQLGFHPIPLVITDLMSSLQGGMVDAFTTTPLSAASYQWFGLAPNMCGMKWAPLLGGIVVTTAAWNKIPVELRDKLQSSAETIGVSMQSEIDKADAQAIEVMKQYGLKISTVPPETEAKWKADVDKAMPTLYGKSLDKGVFDEINKHLAEFRSMKSSRK